jgi:pilus assembly protein Flp/PilA
MLERFTHWAMKSYMHFSDLRTREDGQALVEYGLILALIAVVCIAALQALGTNVSGKLQQIADDIAAA